jgi:hypothetical protein
MWLKVVFGSGALDSYGVSAQPFVDRWSSHHAGRSSVRCGLTVHSAWQTRIALVLHPTR